MFRKKKPEETGVDAVKEPVVSASESAATDDVVAAIEQIAEAVTAATEEAPPPVVASVSAPPPAEPVSAPVTVSGPATVAAPVAPSGGGAGTFFSGLFIGLGLGTVVALLFAPKSGEEMRSQLVANSSPRTGGAPATAGEWRSQVASGMPSQSDVNAAVQDLKRSVGSAGASFGEVTPKDVSPAADDVLGSLRDAADDVRSAADDAASSLKDSSGKTETF